MSIATATQNPLWREAKGRARRAVARMARRVLPDATVRLAHVEPGVRLRVHLRRNLMFWSGGLARYEPASVRVLRAAIEPGDVAFDVGANIGFFTTLLSRRVGAGGKVLAVEPDPENLALLRINLGENGCENVSLAECAVESARGDGDFSRDRATGATGRLGRDATQGELAVGDGRVQVVRTRVETLDDLGDEHGAPAVVKLDIEGGEARALEGGRRILGMHRPIVVTELGGDAGPVARALLRRADYRVWDIESGRPADSGPSPFLALAVPAERLDSARGRRVVAAVGGGDASP
jgi:FkbM family methyltransferase